MPRQPAVCGFQPPDPAQRRRYPDRAVRIRPECDRHQPARHRRAGSAGRPARHPCRVMRVAGGAVMHVLPREVVGVLPHVERAYQDRPRRFHARDQRRVYARRRPRAVDQRPGARRQSRHVEQVLDRERHPAQRSLRRGRRPGQRTFGQHVRERAQRAVMSPEPVQRVLHGGGGRCAPGPDVGRERCGGRPAHARNTGAGSMPSPGSPSVAA